MRFIRKFSKRDLIFSLATGLADGFIIWRIFTFLNIAEFHGLPWDALVLVLPVLWILSVLLGYLLGQWFKFFDQFGRFAVIGVTNTMVDFGILNILISYTTYTSGGGYAWIKVFAFVAALLCSYILNKHWTFHGLSGGKGEFVKFVTVTLASFGVNLLISWAVATFVSPLFGMTVDQWANIANAAGVAIGLIVNFLGFKFAVFKK